MTTTEARDVSPRRRSRLAIFVLAHLGLLAGPAAEAGPADLEHSRAAVRWATRDGSFWDAQVYVSGDYDGDGYTDVARIYGTGAGVTNIDTFVSSGVDFVSARWADSIGGFWVGQHYLAADFNGDGFDDVARVFNDGGQTSIDVLVSGGSYFYYTRWITRSGPFEASMNWAAGDFDGDGLADMARIFDDFLTTSIDVFASVGNGFVPARWVTRDGGYDSGMRFAAGDFDGDGASDLARIFNHEGLVSIDLFHSAGADFSPSERAVTHLGPWGSDPRFASGDWDGDGTSDVALLEGTPGGLTASVFLSDGTGFGRHLLFDAPSRSSRFTVGDYDGDGKTEIAGIDGRYGPTDLEVYGGPTPQWEYWAQAQRWESESGGFWPAQVYLAGDFNGDGAKDVARIFDEGGLTSIDVHQNTGAGFNYSRWATREGGHWGGMEFVPGDFNGDGADDILKIFDDGGVTSIDVYLGGATGFTYQRWLTRQGGHWSGMKFVAGDFNGDGMADMAKVWDWSGLATIDVYLSAGDYFPGFTTWATRDGGFWPEQQYVTGDYTGDGRADVARIFNEGGLTSIDVFTSQGSYFTQRRWITQEGPSANDQKHVSGDFDADGRDDVVQVGANAGGRVKMLIFTSDGAFFEGAHLLEDETGFTVEMKAVAADFDLDGRAEVATAYGTQASHLTQFDVYGGETLVEPFYLSSPGDAYRYSVQEVKDNLAGQGYSLISSSHLVAGQCTIVYPNTGHAGDSKDMGAMACAYQDGGEVSVEWTPVYGGCDVAASGGVCEIGIFDETLSVDVGGAVPVELRVKGPRARVCGQVSRDAVCAKTTATLWEGAFLITDGNGNGGGVGAFAGVGAATRARYHDGVLSGDVAVGLGPGVRVKYSVNLESAASVGESGITYAQEGVDATVGLSGDLIGTIDDAANEVFGSVGDAIGGVVEDVTGGFCDWFGC